MSDTAVQEIQPNEEAILAASKDDESLVPLRDYGSRIRAIYITDMELLYDLMGVEG